MGHIERGLRKVVPNVLDILVTPFLCLLGITEVAIFGVNLRFVKPFIAAAIGGGYVVLMKVGMNGLGVTDIPGIAIVQEPSMVNYIIGMAIAFGVAFAGTFILGFKEEE